MYGERRYRQEQREDKDDVFDTILNGSYIHQLVRVDRLNLCHGCSRGIHARAQFGIFSTTYNKDL